MAREFGGEGSPIYVARVLGEFPEQGSESLFQRSWLDHAAALWERGDLEFDAERCELTLAVDVARYGADATVSALAQGPVVREIRTWNRRGTMETVDGVLKFAWAAGMNKKYGPDDPAVGRILVDTIGVGAGVFDRIRGPSPTGTSGTPWRPATWPSLRTTTCSASFWRCHGGPPATAGSSSNPRTTSSRSSAGARTGPMRSSWRSTAKRRAVGLRLLL
jgi:hypothetical protein